VVSTPLLRNRLRSATIRHALHSKHERCTPCKPLILLPTTVFHSRILLPATIVPGRVAVSAVQAGLEQEREGQTRGADHDRFRALLCNWEYMHRKYGCPFLLS